MLSNQKESQRGQSMVEFAISLTVMLTLLAGVVDLGSAFFSFIALRDAAQEGALYGSIDAVVDTNGNGVYNTGEALNTAAITARVRQSSTQPVDLSDVTNVTVSVVSTTPYCAGNKITVTVEYNYTLTMPLISTILGTNSIPITASATNTILRPSCP